MRFSATFQPMKKALLNGRETKYADPTIESCHEFEIGEQTFDFCRDSVDVTLTAFKYSKQTSLHGPASLKDKTLIYPCDKFRCRIKCPCNLCMKRTPYCKKAQSLETCGECTDCRADFQDHLVFHRASHGMCKFCVHIQNQIPNYAFHVIKERVYYPAVRPQFERFFDKFCMGSLFHHTWNVIHVKQIDSKFSCDKCAKEFHSVSHLKRHEAAVHYGIEFVCSLCGLKFTRHDNLMAHRKLVHCEISDYQCDLCHEAFNKKSNLMRHSKGATKSCNMCSKNFCTMKQLQLHLKTAHPGYTCGKCSKLFQDQANLERHSAGTLKQCDICSQEFCTLGQVQLHKQSVHPNYKCKNCEKSFKDQAHLVRHQQANGMYKNKCDFCRQRFCTKLELMKHIKNHKKRLIELRNGVWKS